MPVNAQKGESQNIFPGLNNAPVRQDKDARSRIFAGSAEPRVENEPANIQNYKHKRHGSNKRRTVEIGVCVSPELKAELERLRDQGGKRAGKISISKVAAQFIEKGVQGHIDMQYGALLRPVIEEAINNRLRSRDARFAALLVRIAYDVGQARALLTNLLARSPGVTPELLNSILDQSGKRAKANLTHLSPQISELMQAVDAWMNEKGEEGSVSAPRWQSSK